MFSRLKRRQGQFFQEASIGLLALVRLAAQDEGGEEEEETPMETVQGMDGHNVFTLGQVRAAIVNDIVQLAQTVRETCDTVGVSFLSKPRKQVNYSKFQFRPSSTGLVPCLPYLNALKHLSVFSSGGTWSLLLLSYS